MNVKPGDLAITHYPGKSAHGRIVEVLHMVPVPCGMHYRLPDGWPAVHNHQGPAWVVKFVGGPQSVTLRDGTARDAWYTGIGDMYLRPLPGEPEQAPADTVCLADSRSGGLSDGT